MKASLPYVPWYHGDFLRSTVGWTLVEQAAYWKLLCAQWEIGPLPDDLTRLASIIGTDPTTMAAIWPVINKKFISTSSGLVNERMEAHRERSIAYRARQSRKGKLGAEARYGATTGTVLPFLKPEGGFRE